MIKAIHSLPSGLRLVHCEMQGTRSVSMGVMTAVGSGNETVGSNGISHFVEHMLFKGTAKRSAFQIAADMDRIGAQINAYTSKQATCFYTISIDDQTEKCAEVLSDILFNSMFDIEEIEREKSVVIEEISESLDDPEDLALDCLGKAYFGTHPLGMSILGTKANIYKMSRTDINNYIDKNYKATSTVIAMVGNISVDKALEIVYKYFEGNFKVGDRTWQDALHVTKSTCEHIFHDFEQSGIGIAFPSYCFNSKNDMALRVLNTVLGGGMSSRLFQQIREKLGLAYSVFSCPSTYINNGYMSIYVGTGKKTAKQAINAIINEIKLLKNGITSEELERGKEQLKGAYVLGQEHSSSMMQLFLKFALFANESFDFEKQVDKIYNVTVDDTQKVIDDIFDMSKMSLSYVGKKPDFDIMDIIHG